MAVGKSMTIRAAVIEVISNSKKKEVTLDQLYEGVTRLLRRNISGAVIRGVINRSLETRSKSGPYPILFTRVAYRTYALSKFSKKQRTAS